MDRRSSSRWGRGAAFGVLVALASVLLVAAPAGAQEPTPSDWPMALHDARHSATSSAIGPTTGHLAWTRDLGATITPGPVIGSDGSVYVATDAGVLHALNPATGADLWTFSGGTSFPDADDLSVSPLVLTSGNILWPGPSSTLFLLSPTGQMLWQHRYSGVLTSPVQAGPSVYLGTTAGQLIALDVSGPAPSTRWTLPVGKSSFASPVVAPDGNIVTTADQRLIVVAERHGSPKVRWTHRFRGLVEVSAAVGRDGTIVVGTNDPFEYAFTPSGSLKWKVRRDTQSYSSPSVSPNGNSYFGGNTGHLQVVKTSTGARVATDHGVQGLWGAQVIDAHGDAYFGTQGKHVYGYGPTGKLLFDSAVNGPIDSYPAMTANGTLIIGDQSGTLYAFSG